MPVEMFVSLSNGSVMLSLIYLCGDYNARIGETDDVIQDNDNLPSRKIIDMTVAGHCDALIDFISDCKLCILNGRKSPEMESFYKYIWEKISSFGLYFNAI